MKTFAIMMIVALMITLAPPVPGNKYEVVGVKAKGYYPQTNRYVIVTKRLNGQTGSCYVTPIVGRNVKPGASHLCQNINRKGKK